MRVRERESMRGCVCVCERRIVCGGHVLNPIVACS